MNAAVAADDPVGVGGGGGLSVKVEGSSVKIESSSVKVEGSSVKVEGAKGVGVSVEQE